jgi:hypothetical protein
MRRGLLEAAAATVFMSLLLLPAAYEYADDPSADLLRNIAQIGATLLVAYGVEISWFLKESRRRGADRENWVGVSCGLGTCGLLGIGLALGLTAHDGSFTLIQEFVFTWSIMSMAMLGSFVAMGPFVIHELSHAAHTDYSDD